jgi:hypothetical protein
MGLVSRHEWRFIGFILSGIGNILWLLWILLGNIGCSQLLLFGGYLIFNSIGVLDEYGTWKKIREYKIK